jgi:hypothetical protein
MRNDSGNPSRNVLALVSCLVLGFHPLGAQSKEPDPKDLAIADPLPSIGSEASLGSWLAGAIVGPSFRTGVPREDSLPMTPDSPRVDRMFEGFGFDDNADENGGSLFIPSDPIGAAGRDRVIAVVNVMIEARNKLGGLEWRESLMDFFSPAATLGTFGFDPKVTYDQYEDRFVVVALERVDANPQANPSGENQSRILLAVSKTGTPLGPTAVDWNYLSIRSKVTIFVDFGPPRGVLPIELWADYPGFEVDEEAIYVTANLFAFPPFQGFQGSRLWIVDKGAGSGGFYDGGRLIRADPLDPYAAAGLSNTTMPAKVFGAGGVPGGADEIGTFLVAYSGLTNGVNEFLQVIRVDDPLGVIGGPFFAHQFVPIGSIEAVPPFLPLPDAPQAGSPALIEVNDRRALDAVWRDGGLWLTTTILPEAGPDAGETTAHWFKLDTSAVPGGPIRLDQQGDIGGESIAPNTSTFFPAVAVNSDGDAQFGFGASAPGLFAGAFVAVREAGDPAGTVRPAETVHAGVDSYVRMLGSFRARWGDYSGISVDPTNDDFAWVFNQFADERGTVILGEDGRWGTAWARCGFKRCDPSPLAQGYWYRQCLGAGFITAGGNGPGPGEVLEPAFVDGLVPEVDSVLQSTILMPPVLRTCEDGMQAIPASDPCEQALKQYTALLLNIASGRLQKVCGTDLADLGCSAPTLGEMLGELAGLINGGDSTGCRQAAGCAGALNENRGIAPLAPAAHAASAR